MRSPERELLSGADSAWWHMEEPTAQMVITAVLTFDAPIAFEEARETLGRRLLRFDRFRQRVAEPRFGLGRPHWEDDPDFSLEHHLFRASLPEPADRRALEAFVGSLMSRSLDFSRPLWEFHLVENYGEGCALVARIHHCIADGLALIYVLLSLDDTPGNEAVAADWATARCLLRRAHAGGPARRAVRLAAGAGAAGGSLLHLLGMSFDPHTSLHGALEVRKRAAWSEPIPLEELRRMGKAMGATVHEVVAGAVAGALRGHLTGEGAPAGGRGVRAVVPVNLRPPSEVGELGNRFGLVFLPLPVQQPDPVRRVQMVRRAMAGLKASPQAAVVYALLHLFGRTPRWVEHLIAIFLGLKATLVMTDVPGPRESIWICGRRMTGLMAWVPQSGRLALGVSVLSYAGQVRIGVAGDARIVPDPGRIVAELQRELRELAQRVGVGEVPA